MRKLLTVNDLAELFQKHENTIYCWITVDQLFPHAFRVRDGWLIPDSDVRRLAEDGRLSRAAAPQGNRNRVREEKGDRLLYRLIGWATLASSHDARSIYGARKSSLSPYLSL